MKYKANHPTQKIENALGLDNSQVKRLKNAIQKAYHSEWGDNGVNIDEINALVAPYIKTQEEAFYAASVILTDIWGAMEEYRKSNVN